MRAPDEKVPKDFIHEITRAQSSIAAYIRSLLPMHPDYMDVLQEVNVTLWEKRKKYQPGSNFKAWAFKIARYHVLYTRRKMASEGKRIVFSNDLLDMMEEAVPFTEEIMESRISALKLCLGRLSAHHRELLRVRYSSGISINDYAHQHDKNPGTIRATLRRLRSALRKCIHTKLRHPGGPSKEEIS